MTLNWSPKRGAGSRRPGSTWRAIVDRAVPLTVYAWKFRCPGDPETLSRNEAQSALTIARETVEAILQRLPEDLRP